MTKLTRRHALSAYWSLVTASRVSRAQELAGEPPGRIPPVDELVNAAEFRAIAERRLDRLTFAEIEGSDRAAFELLVVKYSGVVPFSLERWCSRPMPPSRSDSASSRS